jgi:hypothetical protein
MFCEASDVTLVDFNQRITAAIAWALAAVIGRFFDCLAFLFLDGRGDKLDRDDAFLFGGHDLSVG